MSPFSKGILFIAFFVPLFSYFLTFLLSYFLTFMFPVPCSLFLFPRLLLSASFPLPAGLMEGFRCCFGGLRCVFIPLGLFGGWTPWESLLKLVETVKPGVCFWGRFFPQGYNRGTGPGILGSQLQRARGKASSRLSGNFLPRSGAGLIIP